MNKDIDRIDNLESDDEIKIIEAKTVNLPNRFINQPSGSESDKNKTIIEKETIEQLDVIAVPLGSDKSKKQKVQKSAEEDVNDATEEESPEEQESKEEAEDKGSEKQPSENKETSDSEDSAPKSKENDSSEDETSEDADEDSSADTKEASAPEEGDDSKEDQPSEQEPSSEEKPDQKEQPAPKPEDENADEQPKDNADNSPSGNKVDDAKKAAKQDADTKARSGANKPGDKADDSASPMNNKGSSDLGKNISKAKDIKDKVDKLKNSDDISDAAKEIAVDKVKKEAKKKALKMVMKNPYILLAALIALLLFLIILWVIGIMGSTGDTLKVFNQIHNHENLEFHMRDASDQTFELVSMKKLLMGAAYAKYYDQLKDETKINENLIEQIDNYMVYTRTRAVKLLKYELPEGIGYGFDIEKWFKGFTVLYSELNRGVPYCNPDKGCVKDGGYTNEDLINIQVDSFYIDEISQEDQNYKGTIFYTNENNQLKENASIIPPATDIILSLLEDSYKRTQHLVAVFMWEGKGYAPYNPDDGDEKRVLGTNNLAPLPDYNKKNDKGYTFEHYIEMEISKKKMIQNNEEIPNLPEVYKNAQIYKTKPLVTPLTMAFLNFEGIIEGVKTPDGDKKNIYWNFPCILYNITDHAFKEPNIGALYAWPIGSLEMEEVPESEIVKTFNCGSCKENNNCDSCDEKGVVIRVKDTKVVNEDGTVDVCAINFGRVVSEKYCDISGCKPSVVIFHDNGHVSIYENLKSVESILYTEVSLAQKIGTIEVGEELRIQIRENGEHLNPLDYIDINRPRPSASIDELVYEEGETEKQTICSSLLKTGYSGYAVAGIISNFEDETFSNYTNDAPWAQECHKEASPTEESPDIENDVSTKQENKVEIPIKCKLEQIIKRLNRDIYYETQIVLLYSTSSNYIAKKFCQTFYGGDNKEYICENITVGEADLEYVGNGCSNSE